MKVFKEDPHRVVILGAGTGGTAILEMLLDEPLVQVAAIVDLNSEAPGLALAGEHGVAVYDSVEQCLNDSVPCVAFNMTGNEMVEAVAADILGAGGVIGGLESQLMYDMVTNLKKAKKALYYEANHDPLTGLYNRRHILEQLQQGVSQALRYKHAFTVVMFDLDHFKQVNDVYGHAAGDIVLTHIAKIVRKNVRDADVPGRWGGEEFIVLLPHTALDGARQVTAQWLKQVNASLIRIDSNQSISVSFSAGIASLDMAMEKKDIQVVIEQLLHKVDECMYAAKRTGRNRICTGVESEGISTVG